MTRQTSEYLWIKEIFKWEIPALGITLLRVALGPKLGQKKLTVLPVRILRRSNIAHQLWPFDY